MKAFRSLVVLMVLVGGLQVGIVQAQTSAPTAAAALPGKWQLLPPWMLLQQGMSQAQVTALLGQPSQQKNGSTVSWVYMDPATGQSASMTFKNGGLYSWESPRFVTADGAKNTTWKNPVGWAALVKGMSMKQVEKLLGVTTWLSTKTQGESWIYYDANTGKTGTASFRKGALFYWDAPAM